MSRMVFGDSPARIDVLYESCGFKLVWTTSSLQRVKHHVVSAARQAFGPSPQARSSREEHLEL